MERAYLGNELMYIVYENGTFAVYSSFEEDAPVFTGTYADCFKYVGDAVIEYEESLF